uniref:Ig-like domain-containing protein n=1 Tax=Ditylenchus dipsaci TaxID=166011 RepID=A0A915E5P6_9BILA
MRRAKEVNLAIANWPQRFDYSDVSFGNTHSQGATVTITCTANGQPATVEGFDQQRASITATPSLIASCTNVGGSQYTWTILGRILQFVDCRF